MDEQTEEHTEQNGEVPVWARKAGKAFSLVGRIGAIVFGLVWLSGVGTISSFIGSQLYQEVRKPLYYVPVEAVVTKYTAPTFKTDEFGEATSTAGIIEYAYSVAGRSFKDEYRQPDKGARLNEYSRKLTGTFGAADALSAWYDPDKLQDSTLEPIAQPYLLGFVIFILPFLAIGVGMIYSGVTGKGPGFRPVQRRSGGSSRGGMTVTGGGAYFMTFAILCAVTAFAFFGISMLLHWKAAWVVGLVLLLNVIPLLTILIGRFFVRRREARAAAPPDAPTAEPDAAKSSSVTLAAQADKLPRLAGKLAGMIGVTIFWCGIMSVFIVIVVGSILRHRDAKARFVATEGVVLASKVKTHAGDSDSGPTYEPLIKYRYTVAGQEHTSTQYSFGTWSTSDSQDAGRIVRRHPKGRKITVYYDPDDPAEAILALEVPGIQYFMLLFLQPFILVGLGLIGYTATIPLRHRRLIQFLTADERSAAVLRIPTWGQLRPAGGGVSIQGGRSAFVKALIGVVAGYGLTCFVSIFVVGFLFDGFDDPDPGKIFSAILIAAGVGVLAGVAAFGKKSGNARLHIDASLGRLELTSPRRRVELQLDDVECWTLRPIPNPHKVKSNTDLATAPLLAVRTTAGDQVPVHVFRANKAAATVALKSVRILAALTGKNFNVLDAETPQETQEMPRSPADVIAHVRRAYQQSKEYADLT